MYRPFVQRWPICRQRLDMEFRDVIAEDLGVNVTWMMTEIINVYGIIHESSSERRESEDGTLKNSI